MLTNTNPFGAAVKVPADEPGGKTGVGLGAETQYPGKGYPKSAEGEVPTVSTILAVSGQAPVV
jgi:hypothetical protein